MPALLQAPSAAARVVVGGLLDSGIHGRSIPMPEPGTHEDDIMQRLIPAMSRAGRQVDLDACARLARMIQARGHRDRAVRKAARTMGLNPKYLPRKRS